MEALRQQRDVARTHAVYDKENNPDSSKNKCIDSLKAASQWLVANLQFVLLSIAFNALSIILLFVNLGALGMMIPAYKDIAVFDIGDTFVLVCNVFLLLEILMKMVAWGLWKKQTPPLQRVPFFRSITNIIEFIVCIMAFILPNKIITVARCVRLLKVNSVPLLLFFVPVFCVHCNFFSG